jgi:GH24 family phage-related lysozyme (muramidase)/uncharacterized protein YcbK (DUF882 family)
MGTWVKATDTAIYLMKGNGFLDTVVKRPSRMNAKEQVADITPLKDWFTRIDKPHRMTVSRGTNAPEPEPIQSDEGGAELTHNGQLKIVTDTYLKLSPEASSSLPDTQKTFVSQETILNLISYENVGNAHWRIELAPPLPGDGTTASWYIFVPHIRLMADAVLTTTHDTYFKLEPQISSDLPDSAKVFVRKKTAFNITSFLPAFGDHTSIELADTALGDNNETFWYVYNLHFKARLGERRRPGETHDGMRIEAINDTYFTLRPNPPQALPAQQKVAVQSGTTFAIQSYTTVSDSYWKIRLLEPELGDGQTTNWYVNPQDTNLISNVTLTITEDTSLKREPRQSSQLPSAAKVFARKNSQLQIISHLPATGNHTQIELANAALFPGNEALWYAYNPHISIEGQRQFLRVTADTVLKSRAVSSAELAADQKVEIPKNTVLELSSYQQPQNNHVKVTLKGAFLGTYRRNTWYCYIPHITIVGTEVGNQPNDSNRSSPPPSSGDRGIPLQLPGLTDTYYSNDPIFKKTQYGEQGHFTWGEALHVDPRTGTYRRPTSPQVIKGIQRIAYAMEEVRKRYGDVPIIVKSWYRDSATNQEISGFSQSRHTVGDAIDFVVTGVHPYTVYADLDDWWGNKGGLASSSTFTHIDARGYKARWEYDDSATEKMQPALSSPLNPPNWSTWVKETDVAIYLMRENRWLSRILKTPSKTNPLEQVLDLDEMAQWFAMPNAPTGLTISVETGAPEPDKWSDTETPGHTGEINASGLELVKHFEGLRTTAYRDAVGIWTIGYGHTSMAGPPRVVEGMTITEAEAEAILAQDLDVFERGVVNALAIPTNADQFSAMVSFAFNLGVGAFRSSTLLKRHNAGSFGEAADEFLRWVFADGERLAGLERRRKAERALYLSEDFRAFTRARSATVPMNYSRAAAVTAGAAAIAGLAFGAYTRFVRPSDPVEQPTIPETISPTPNPLTPPAPTTDPTQPPTTPSDDPQPVG